MSAYGGGEVVAPGRLPGPVIGRWRLLLRAAVQRVNATTAQQDPLRVALDLAYQDGLKDEAGSEPQRCVVTDPTPPAADRDEIAPEIAAKRIWRYMDPMKLFQLLTYRALYFPRLNQLGDPHEGSLGRLNTQQLLEKLNGVTDPKKVTEIVDAYNATRPLRVEPHAVSCWHASEGESAAMWGMYAPRGLGVAIQTTVGQFVKAFQGRREIFATEVQYYDYEQQWFDPTNPISAVVRKRHEHKFEAEFRFFTALEEREQVMIEALLDLHRYGQALVKGASPGTWELMNGRSSSIGRICGPGILVPCDLNELIQAVYLAPNCPLFHVKLIEDVLRKMNLAAPVRQTIIDRPLYDHISYRP